MASHEMTDRKLPPSRLCAWSPALRGAPTAAGRAVLQAALLECRAAHGTVPAITFRPLKPEVGKVTGRH